MEWLTDDSVDQENMMVDIGYMPQMELKSMTPSKKADEQIPHSSSDSDQVFEQILINSEKPSISWTEEITTDKAMDILSVKMFPFKEVSYLNVLDIILGQNKTKISQTKNSKLLNF